MKWGDKGIKFSDLYNYLGEYLGGKKPVPMTAVLVIAGVIVAIIIAGLIFGR